MTIKFYLGVLLAVTVPVGCFSQNGIIDYSGQIPPADLVVVFAPGSLSPDTRTFGITFSPTGDELFLTVYHEKI